MEKICLPVYICMYLCANVVGNKLKKNTTEPLYHYTYLNAIDEKIALALRNNVLKQINNNISGRRQV